MVTSKRILVTGAAGFIGSNLVKNLLANEGNVEIVGLDSLTYAADPSKLPTDSRFHLYCADLRDYGQVEDVVSDFDPEIIYHLAAESHVDNSISDPRRFMEANVVGTFNLLEVCRKLNPGLQKFIHVSTDEVFGELNLDDAPFTEESQIAPRSPYSASKAASDHFVLAYHHTFNLPVVVTNCSNNFGPNQHKEKLIPKVIESLRTGQTMTVYGTGQNVRDWIFVEDHCNALRQLADRGVSGERYCIGGNIEFTNIGVLQAVQIAYSDLVGSDTPLIIKHTNDRPTDDKRYAINTEKINRIGINSNPEHFYLNLKNTIRSYLV